MPSGFGWRKDWGGGFGFLGFPPCLTEFLFQSRERILQPYTFSGFQELRRQEEEHRLPGCILPVRALSVLEPWALTMNLGQGHHPSVKGSGAHRSKGPCPEWQVGVWAWTKCLMPFFSSEHPKKAVLISRKEALAGALLPRQAGSSGTLLD